MIGRTKNDFEPIYLNSNNSTKHYINGRIRDIELEPFVCRIQGPPDISTISFKQKWGVEKNDIIICGANIDTTRAHYPTVEKSLQ